MKFGSCQMERELWAGREFHYEKLVVSLRLSTGFITTFYWFHYDFLGDRLVAIWCHSPTSDFSFLISQYHQMCLEARCTKGLTLVILVVILVIFSAGF